MSRVLEIRKLEKEVSFYFGKLGTVKMSNAKSRAAQEGYRLSKRILRLIREFEEGTKVPTPEAYAGGVMQSQIDRWRSWKNRNRDLISTL